MTHTHSTPADSAPARTAAPASDDSDKRVKETIGFAAQNPDVDQPYAELGLKSDEYQRIREVLGRRPTSAELAMYSVMWSEHCSYKSSKVHLRKFGENVTDDMKKRAPTGRDRRERRASSTSATAGPSPSRWRATTAPSYVEPYQGAATGVGGIVATSSPWVHVPWP